MIRVISRDSVDQESPSFTGGVRWCWAMVVYGSVYCAPTSSKFILYLELWSTWKLFLEISFGEWKGKEAVWKDRLLQKFAQIRGDVFYNNWAIGPPCYVIGPQVQELLRRIIVPAKWLRVLICFATLLHVQSARLFYLLIDTYSRANSWVLTYTIICGALVRLLPWCIGSTEWVTIANYKVGKSSVSIQLWDATYLTFRTNLFCCSSECEATVAQPFSHQLLNSTGVGKWRWRESASLLPPALQWVYLSVKWEHCKKMIVCSCCK